MKFTSIFFPVSASIFDINQRYKKKPRRGYLRGLNLDAEAGGFEPPVRLPVRQFSKLVVSATHPNFLPFEVPGGFEPPYTVLQTAD